MKAIGVVKKFNGKFGLIETPFGIVDFSYKDISYNVEIKPGFIVEFRLEEKDNNLKIARNIKVIKKQNYDV